jgi:hypothetical protein
MELKMLWLLFVFFIAMTIPIVFYKLAKQLSKRQRQLDKYLHHITGDELPPLPLHFNWVTNPLLLSSGVSLFFGWISFDFYYVHPMPFIITLIPMAGCLFFTISFWLWVWRYSPSPLFLLFEKGFRYLRDFYSWDDVASIEKVWLDMGIYEIRFNLKTGKCIRTNNVQINDPVGLEGYSRRLLEMSRSNAKCCRKGESID